MPHVDSKVALTPEAGAEERKSAPAGDKLPMAKQAIDRYDLFRLNRWLVVKFSS